MKKRDFETYQKRFRDFEILPKFSETHVSFATPSSAMTTIDEVCLDLNLTFAMKRSLQMCEIKLVCLRVVHFSYMYDKLDEHKAAEQEVMGSNFSQTNTEYVLK